MRHKKGLALSRVEGFTLIELLVVIAIIGLLTTIGVVALNDARIKSRDAKRLGDLKQMSSALELYYVGANSYPAQDVVLGNPDARVLDATGFHATPTAGEQVFMGLVPRDPQNDAATSRVYNYFCAAPCSAYNISFRLERPVATYGDANGDGVISCVSRPDGLSCD
ncbi:MAG: prepilin-type N-terminal cleavage/methylation domain-containing protein [Patescibacteria group bacterium]